MALLLTDLCLTLMSWSLCVISRLMSSSHYDCSKSNLSMAMTTYARFHTRKELKKIMLIIEGYHIELLSVLEACEVGHVHLVILRTVTMRSLTILAVTATEKHTLLRNEPRHVIFNNVVL